MNNLKTGDVVYLKGGSPALTVQEVAGNDVHVTWFKGEEVERNRFYSDQLTTENPGRARTSDFIESI